MFAYVLFALLSLIPWHGDRALSYEERVELLTPVAQAIVAVARTKDEAAFLAAQAWHETKLAALVVNGMCDLMPRGQQCDPDRHGAAQSHGPWQAKHRWCDVRSLESQAACALRMARRGFSRCKTWEGAFAAQLGSGACTSPRSAERVLTMTRMLRKMEEARWKENHP